MTEGTPSPAPDAALPASAPTESAPAAKPGWRARLALPRLPKLPALPADPIVMIFFGLCIGVSAGVFAVTHFGSAADGSPVVSLKLAPMEQPGEAAQPAARAVSFRSARSAGGHLIADPAFIEDGIEGPLPAIAADGRTPLSAYARPFDRNDKRPKIAIVINGVGVGVNDTNLALVKLPPQVTLAVAPFAPDLQNYVDRARGAGFELLLELPMEPSDFPESDPGPHALLVAASSEENTKRLEWTLSRITGYVGITNLLGGRFMGQDASIEPVLAQVAKRGLMFFDDGASSTSVAMTSARHAKATIATGTLMLDGVPSQAAIDAKLVELETQAKQDGAAIGVGSRFPVTIARVAEWAASADARGFHLVPVSALAARPSDAQATDSTAER